MLLFVALAVMSCNKDTNSINNSSEEKVTLGIKIKNILKVETKGLQSQVQFLNGDIKAVLLDENGEVYEQFDIRRQDDIYKQYNKKVYLTNESLSLYTVWNQYEGAIEDFTSVPISITNQIDYLYGTPAININKYNPEAEISLQHCLTAVNFELSKGNYAGEGNISKLYVKSAGLGISGKLDATTGEIFDIQGLNENIPIDGGFNINNKNRISAYLLVPSGENSKITFIIEMDGQIFEAETEDITLSPGTQYQFTLKFSSQEMGGITVDGETMKWTFNDQGNINVK